MKKYLLVRPLRPLCLQFSGFTSMQNTFYKDYNAIQNIRIHYLYLFRHTFDYGIYIRRHFNGSFGNYKMYINVYSKSYLGGNKE